jgi:GxxExxY protein
MAGMRAAFAVHMRPAVSAESLNRITSNIIECAIRIHRSVGPGLLESAYFGCLRYELVSSGLRIETQKALPLMYQGVQIDCAYRADLVVEDCIIVEVKALEALAPIHSRQLLTYLRVADCPLGLLLNFGSKTMKEGIKRVVNRFPE